MTGQSAWSGPPPDAVALPRTPVRAGAEPIKLQGSAGRAVLLLHGFGDTPQTFCYLAPALHEAGLTVHAPLLPGHGTTVEDFDRTDARDWLAAARTALHRLRDNHDSVGLTGLSMGGALAILLAAEAQWVRALVLIAPYLQMPPRAGFLSAVHRVWGPFTGVIKSGSEMSIHDPAERARNVGYGACTARTLHELWRVGRAARRALPRVTAPTLIIQSRTDNRLRPRIAERAYASLGSKTKRLSWVENAGHIVTVDYGYDRVNSEARGWFAAHLASPATGAK